MFSLTLDGHFEAFLEEGFTWGATTVANRGFTSDASTVEGGRTAKQKAAYLNLMLQTIATNAQVIARPFITEDALSLNDIWNRLRIRYGFRKSGGLMLDLPGIRQEEDESYEGLWERMYAFVSDNLLKQTDGLQHLRYAAAYTEKMTPSLLNATVSLWLNAIHPGLNALVKQKFSTSLRNKTLATLREEISESLDAMMMELRGESAHVARAPYSSRGRGNSGQRSSYQQRPNRVCPLCAALNRPSNHFLSECSHLPDSDRRYMQSRARSRAIDAIDEDYLDEVIDDVKELPVKRSSISSDDMAAVKKVDIGPDPLLEVKYRDQSLNLLIDGGANANLMRLSYARQMNIPISKSVTKATNADTSNLKIVGEVHVKFTKDDLVFDFDGLVAEKLADSVIAGSPFQEKYDVYARPALRMIGVGDRMYPYAVKFRPVKIAMVKNPRQTALLPGDFLDVQVPEVFSGETSVAVEPRVDAASVRDKKPGQMWIQPHVAEAEEGHIRLKNNSPDPVLIGRHEQIAVIRPVTDAENVIAQSGETYHSDTRAATPVVSESKDYLEVSIDPDNILTASQRDKFKLLHEDYKGVFDGRTIGGYNGASGPLDITINMGPTLPPQRKGRMPLYSRNQQVELQRVSDELEGTVLLKPEDVGVVCEYLNPSFLVKKSNGKWRFVTAFTEVGKYTKPQPALMSDINASLRQIAEWEWVITTDMSSSYHQMFLNVHSMKYCGVVTPFKGVRVYGRGAMGMPGTETALEEMLYRILGDQIAAGHVTKVADDLYCGGKTPEEAMERWKKVLSSMEANGLRLSAKKTVICPKSVMILGWLWENGTIRASPHKVSALIAVSPPEIVGKLRSYVGSFKYLSRTMPGYSDVLMPLEDAIAGRDGKDKLVWTDDLLAAFKLSQDHLKTAKALTLPRPEDQLQLITDASNVGIASALYVIRGGKKLIAGHFNARYKKHQRSWLPCDHEALSICAGVTHFGPDIINNHNQTLILTDSLPCVQAYKKLGRGQFSSSARVATFLSALSRYNVHVMHLKGSDNTYSDYASRNPVECREKRCDVCKFVAETSDSVVRSCSVNDVLESAVPVPFSSRSGWHELQRSDETMRRACAHLKQGTTPSKKDTKIKDVKRYLQIARVARDGLLVVYQHSSVAGRSEKIVVPRSYLHGLLECLHLKLNHPSKSQLRQVFTRAYYALNLEEVLDAVSKGCHTCVSLADMPNRFLQQTSTTVPTAVGSNFSADVVVRSGQHVLVMREYISSYTVGRIVRDEKAQTLRTGLLILCNGVTSSSGPVAVVKVDPASSFRSLLDDAELKRNGVKLELGHAKYKNKNPVAERAIREVHAELNRLLQDSTEISEKVLSKAMANLNGRIRSHGLSAREIWTQRDQFTGKQIPVDDLMMIRSQEEKKKKNHITSAVFKARGRKSPTYPSVERGDLIYINSDRDKTKGRDRYMVVNVSEGSCTVQKFSGMQLRARPYEVNLADVTVVQPWRFDVSEPESNHQEWLPTYTDEGPLAAPLVVGTEEDVLSGSDDSADSDAGSDVQEEINPTPEGTTTRAGRKTKPPPRFQDYNMDS